MRDELTLAVEDFVVDLIYGVALLPGRVYGACRQVVRLFADAFDGAPGGRYAFEDELAEMIAPHLAVLVHKRSRMFVPEDEGAVERWRLELRCFIDCSLLPIMGEERAYAERNLGIIAELLDRVIAREQNKPSVQRTAPLLPSVTPFDSSWAT